MVFRRLVSLGVARTRYLFSGRSRVESESELETEAETYKVRNRGLNESFSESDSASRAPSPPTATADRSVDVGAALTLGRLPPKAAPKRAFPDSSPRCASNAAAAAAGARSEDKASAAAPPAAKAQVVGWPPVRNYRKNTLAASVSKSKAGEEGTAEWGPMYVKVSMDGAPYLRKVDLKMYSSYEDLSMALEKMFSCFIAGQSGLRKSSSKDRLTNGSKADALQDQEYVLTYEDKDADWMLVGDLPWDLFTTICRKLKIMRGSDAAGIGPRSLEQTGQNK